MSNLLDMESATTQESQMTVEIYKLTASNGRHIRTATKVTFEDGITVRFMERMSKREAIRQAILHRERNV